MIVKKRAIKHDTINIPDSFLDLKIPEFSQYYPDMTGSKLEQYLYVNNKVRQENNAQFRELCGHSLPEKLWSGRFNRMPGAGKASFADHRTYLYRGEKIDKQVHLGHDIASVRHAPVKAANRGKVIFADYRGIYGNTVVVDHGTGIFSLYSHMSQISVEIGDIVEKNDPWAPPAPPAWQAVIISTSPCWSTASWLIRWSGGMPPGLISILKAI